MIRLRRKRRGRIWDTWRKIVMSKRKMTLIRRMKNGFLVTAIGECVGGL